MQSNRIMMLYRALLILVLVTLSGAVASETSLRVGEEDSSEETSTNNRDLKYKPDGILICKKWGRDSYRPTNLPSSYRLPGDLYPYKPGFVFDETCQAVPVTCPCFTAEFFGIVVNTEGCGPKFCIVEDDPDFVDITTDCSEGGCSGYNCGSPWMPGAPDKLSCDFRPDYFYVHFDDITAAENEACQAIIITEQMSNCTFV
jgi:hypothetical protein